MTTYEITQIIAKLKALFPKSDWTEDLYGLFTARAMKYDLSAEQGMAIVAEHRVNMRARSPQVGTLLRMFKDAAYTTPAQEKFYGKPAEAAPVVRDFVRDPEPPLIAPKFNGAVQVMPLAAYDAKTGNNFSKGIPEKVKRFVPKPKAGQA